MKKINIAILTLLLILCFSFLFFGCKKEGIKFYRESAVSKVISDFKEDNLNYKHSNSEVKKSSGVIIYKDTQYQNSKSHSFGPKDIDFSMPMDKN